MGMLQGCGGDDKAADKGAGDGKKDQEPKKEGNDKKDQEPKKEGDDKQNQEPKKKDNDKDQESKQEQGSAGQIVDDAMQSAVFPNVQSPKGMTIASRIFYMALGGLIVAAAITAFNFIVAKRSQARETSGRSAVELPAAAIEA